MKGFEQRHKGVAVPVSRHGAGHSPRQGALGKVSSRWGTSIQLAVGLERVHCTCPALWEEERVGGQLSSLRALQDLLISPSLVRCIRHWSPLVAVIESLSVTDMSGERWLSP